MPPHLFEKLETVDLRHSEIGDENMWYFRFPEYFASNSKLRSNFVETFGLRIPDNFGTPPVPRAVFVETHHKYAVFQAVVRIAFYVVTETQKFQTEMALEGLRRAADDR